MHHAFFTCIIVDDERLLRASLSDLLKRHCPDFVVTGVAANATEARMLISAEKPDVIFCDINMPGENGFDLLESMDTASCHIVFVTAYSEYALKALKMRAFDYLLKPIDADELKMTAANLRQSILEKTLHREKQVAYQQSLQELVHELHARQPGNNRIGIHHATGISFIAVDDILYLEGEGAYTAVHLAEGKKMVASRMLSEFEPLLPEAFVRIHKSTIVNLQHVKEYNRADGFRVVLLDGTELTIGRRRVQEVLHKFQQCAKSI